MKKVLRSRSSGKGRSDSEGYGSPPPSLRAGTRVEARYRGKSKYYPGVISRVTRSGTYDIEYDDGEQESGVDPSFVRKLGGGGGLAHSPRGRGGDMTPRKGNRSLSSDFEAVEETTVDSFRMGDIVEARFGGKSKWYKGRVTRVRLSGAMDITYDDGDKEENVSASLVRPLKRPGSGGGRGRGRG